MRDMSTESPTAPPQAPPSHIEVEEITTIIRTPMLRPTPAFRKVIHFGGGKGETFTMSEMIDFVKKYIEDRKLYDEQDPRIVYCKGNDLEAAFHVESFTVSDVLNLFGRHCFEEADSHLRIKRQVITRPVHDKQSTSSSQEEVQESLISPSSSSPSSSPLLSSAPMPKCKSTSNVKLRPTPAFLKVIHLGGGKGETFTLNEIMDYVKKYIEDQKLYDERDPRIVYCKGNDLGTAFNVDSFTVSPELLNLFKSHCHPESKYQKAANKHAESEYQKAANQHADAALEIENQPTSSSQGKMKDDLLPLPALFVTSSSSSSTLSVSSSSTHERKSSHRNICPTKSPSIRAAHPSTTLSSRDLEILQLESSRCVPSTSVSVMALDEIDGDPSPWSCQLRVDMGEPEPNGEGSHNSLVVEYSSDNFSLEYELVSSSEPEQLPNMGDTEESESPSNSEAASFYVVCEESDIEYLADYSDSNTESDAELKEEDKWQCNQCSFKNSALYRNCGKCWSLRPDWLPTDSSGIGNMKIKNKTVDKIFDKMTRQKLFSNTCSITDTSPSEPEKIADVDAAKVISTESSECLSPSPCLVPSFSQDSAIGSMACSQEPAECDVNSTSKKLEAKSENFSTKPCDSVIKKKIRSKKRRYSSSFSDTQEELESKKSVKVGKTPRVNCKSEEKDNQSLKDPCVICLTRPRTACIVHGKTGHQVCCYRCGRRLKKQRKSCPVCRRPIQKVVRNYF